MLNSFDLTFLKLTVRPMKKGNIPKGKDRLPVPSIFRGYVSFREGHELRIIKEQPWQVMIYWVLMMYWPSVIEMFRAGMVLHNVHNRRIGEHVVVYLGSTPTGFLLKVWVLAWLIKTNYTPKISKGLFWGGKKNTAFKYAFWSKLNFYFDPTQKALFFFGGVWRKQGAVIKGSLGV